MSITYSGVCLDPMAVECLLCLINRMSLYFNLSPSQLCIYLSDMGSWEWWVTFLLKLYGQLQESLYVIRTVLLCVQC
jgi:hypothetical protein